MKASYTYIRFFIFTFISLLATINISAQTEITLGTGTNSTEIPFRTASTDSRTQILYTATDFAAAGASTGSIVSIGFDVSSHDNTVMQGMNILMQNSSLTQLVDFVNTNWDTVYTGDYKVSSSGWNKINLQKQFLWDGNSNILIQICYDNSTNANNSYVRSTTSTNMAISATSGTTSGCSISSAATQTHTPNIRFGFIKLTETDLGVVSFVNPNSPTISPNASNPITVKITNYGTMPQSNFDIKYSINNGATYISEIYTGTLAIGDTVDYTFSQTADLSIAGYYKMIAAVVLANDSGNYNDTLRKGQHVCTVMNGSYTIGPGADQNYPDLHIALQALRSCGLNGPVTLSLSDNVFDGSYVIDSIAGINATNTLTIRCQDGNTILTNSQATYNNPYVFKLDNAEYIILNDLIFNNYNTDHFVAVLLTNSSNHNTIKNCKFYCSNSQQNTYGILASSANNYAANGDNANFLQINNNEFIGGYTAISLTGKNNLIPCVNNTIINNTFNNQINSVLEISKNENLLIENNIINDGSATTNFASAFYITYCRGKVEILKNVINKTNSGTGFSFYGLNQNYTTNDSMFVANNMISMLDHSIGIKNQNSNSIKYYNNTVLISGTDPESYAMKIDNNSSNIKLQNNILDCESGYAIHSSTSDTALHSDYNDLFTRGTKFAYLSNDLSFANWKTQTNGDDNSVSLDPIYYAQDNLHISSSQLDNLGMSTTYITDDIDNEARGISMCDIGADEYTPPANDIRITEIQGFNDNSCGLSNSEIITVVVNNNGNTNQSNITLKYQINNGSIVSETMTSLNANKTDTFSFIATADLSSWGALKIKAWSDLSTDQIRENDTVAFITNNTLLITQLPISEDFEDTIFNFKLESNADAKISVESNIGYNNSKAVHMNGGEYDGWTYYGSDITQIISQNSSHKATVATCDVNTSSLSELKLSLKLKMQGMNSDENWFWVSANGQFVKSLQGDSVWKNTTTKYIDIEFNLTPFIGGQLQLSLNGILKSLYDDNIYIDNLNLYEPKQNDVGVTKISTSDHSLCGSTTDSLFVSIKNYGTLAQTNIPIQVDINATTNNTLTATYSGTLAPNAIDSIYVGAVDNTNNELVSIAAYTKLTNDDNNINDTLKLNFYNFKYHKIDYLSDFENMNISGPTNENNTWSLQEFYFQNEGTLGLTSKALALSVSQQSTTIKADFKKNIGIITSNSNLSFDFRFLSKTEFKDSIKFIITNCNNISSTIFTIDQVTNPLDLNWHNYSIPIGQFAGDRVRISVDVKSEAGSNYSIAIDNFGIQNSFDVDLGNDTLLCFGDTLIIDTQLDNNDYSFSWIGPGVDANDTLATLEALAAGTYFVIATNNSGIAKQDTIIVNFTTEITSNTIASKSNICIGDSTYLQTYYTGDFPLYIEWSSNSIIKQDTTTGTLEAYFKPIVNTLYKTRKITDMHGCVAKNTDSINIVVNAIPTVSISNFSNKYCLNADSDTLIGMPTNGTYYGIGQQGIIAPMNLGLGTKQIIYSYTDVNNCSNNDTISFEIVANTPASFTTILNTSYCLNDDTIALIAQPSGGNFIGSGITNDSIFLNAANSGSQEYVYLYTDANGCTDSDTLRTIFNTLPAVSLLAFNDACEQDAVVNLTGGTPAGGDYYGDAISTSASAFYPSIAGIGSSNITYKYTDPNGCSASAAASIRVISTPAADFTIDASICKSEVANINYTGGASTSAIYNWTLDNGNILSGTAQGPYQISWDTASIRSINLSVTDSGCTSTLFANSIIIKEAVSSINYIGNDTACYGQEVVIYTNSGSSNTYQWFDVNGNIATSQDTLSYFNASQSGQYYVQNNNSNGCIAISDTIDITIHSEITSSFTTPAVACKDGLVGIVYTGNANSTATYNWDFDNGIINSGTANGPYQLSWDNAGLKGISLTIIQDGCNSSTTSSFTNILQANALISTSGNNSACFGQSVGLFTNSNATNTYQWFDTSGNITSTQDTLSYFSAVQSGMYYVQNTNLNGCMAISDTLDITINGEIISDFAMPTISCINDMVSISYNGTSGSSSNFNWDFDNGTIASGSNSGPYNIIWNNDSIKNVSLQIQDNGCSSEITKKAINIEKTPAMITALGNLSFCNGGSVSLSANAGPYTYQWFHNGINTNNTQAIYQANQAGKYIVEITNTNTSCSGISDSVMVVVNTDDFNIAFAADQTTFTIPPFNVNYSNQTPNSNEYYWIWSFGDGNTTTFVNPAHQYNYDGNYSVGLIAQNVNTGCFDTLVKTDYINCSGGSPNPCNLDASFTNIGGNETCSTDSVKLSANDHTTAINYQWLRDGIILSGATDSIYYAKLTGLYQLMVSDASCSVFSQPFSLTQLTAVTPSILTNGSIQPCTNDSMELYVSTSFNNYQWSNGATSPNIYVQTSGSYIVTVTDNNGCSASSTPYTVNASLLQVPEICIVGIDTATNHNRVIWERSNENMIDSFKVYRESTVAGVYDLIGSQPFNTLSVFEDINSNPAQMAYRYRITAVDTCGMETAPSPIHKTLHLTINAGLGGVWNLIWTNYEGFNFGSYKIYRSSDSTNMQLLTQIQSNLTSYTDLNPPTGDVFYQIEVVSPHPCYPDSIFTKVNTNYNSSRSNTANTARATNTGLNNYQNNNIEASIFPNPNKGQFTLEIGNLDNSNVNMRIYNTIGTEILTEDFNTYGSTSKQIDLRHLPKGVYFIQLRSSKGDLYRGKVIIN